MSFISWLVVVIVVFVVLWIVIKGLKASAQHKREKSWLHYEQKSRFFSITEADFLVTLETIISNPNLRVFGQVRMIDIVSPIKGKDNYLSAFNKVKSKHFDYVICNQNDFSILCVIELQDSTHRKADRVKSDKFKRKVCEWVGLPLITTRARKKYHEEEVMAAFPAYILTQLIDDTENNLKI
jgi:hypothetical protein